MSNTEQLKDDFKLKEETRKIRHLETCVYVFDANKYFSREKQNGIHMYGKPRSTKKANYFKCITTPN